MKRPVTAVAALLALVSCGKADNPPAVQWQHTFEGAEMTCVQQAADGGFIAAGDTLADTATHAAASRDMYLVKYDSLGNAVWSRRHGAPMPATERLYGLCLTSDGGFAAAGYCDPTPSFGATRMALTVRFDSLGNILWTDTAAAPSEADDIVLASDGGLVSVGAVLFDSIRMRKLNGSGGLEWQVGLPEVVCPFEDFPGSPLAVQRTSDGGYVTSCVRVHKTDSLGNVQWSRQFDDVTVLFSTRQTADGGYIATGIAPDPQKPENDFNLVLLKMNSQGNRVWKKLYRDGGPTIGRQVWQNTDGGFFVVGKSDSLYLLRTNSQGSVVWAGRPTGLVARRPCRGIQTLDGGQLLALADVLAKLASEGQ